MVVIADLICCTDEYLTSELNDFLKSEGVASVEHVSHLFSRINCRYTELGEVEALQAAGSRFFAQFGVLPAAGSLFAQFGVPSHLAEVEPQWELAMKLRSRQVAFSHPPRLLLTGGADGGGIDLQRLLTWRWPSALSRSSPKSSWLRK